MRHTEPSLFIDDRGLQTERRRWSTEPTRTRATADPLVCDRGFIEIRDKSEGLQVRLRPLIVSGAAVAALLFYLAERRPNRCAIIWLDRSWHFRICTDARSLISTVATIIETSARLTLPQPFIATPRNLQPAFQDGHPFEPLLRLWLQERSNEKVLEFLATCGLRDRAMIAEQNGDSGSFRLRHFGRAIRLYDPSWTNAAVGRRVRDQPDAAYGAWIEDGCREATRSQSPRYELVNALVRASPGQPKQWRYERLVLPWMSKSGRPVVISVSLPDRAPGH